LTAAQNIATPDIESIIKKQAKKQGLIKEKEIELSIKEIKENIDDLDVLDTTIIEIFDN